MNSQISPAALPQPRKLSFFPASFSDETLFSRVSRYHLLSGEKKDEVTFHMLFGQAESGIDFTELAPPRLAVLASLLPGDPMVQLGNILVENTFVPFAVPVIASSVDEFVGPEFGDSKACLRCLEEDEALVGVPYLRRSHQLPAVTACWKHAIRLIDACPNCERHFQQPGRFLSAPLSQCGCKWHVTDGYNVSQATKAEHEFAIHAHRVMEKRFRQTPLAVSVRFFQSNIEKSTYKILPVGRVNRRLLTGLIVQQFAEGRSTTEIAMAAAEVIASTRKANWWITSVSPDVLKLRSIRRQGSK